MLLLSVRDASLSMLKSSCCRKRSRSWNDPAVVRTDDGEIWRNMFPKLFDTSRKEIERTLQSIITVHMFLRYFFWLSRHIMMYPICIYIYIPYLHWLAQGSVTRGFSLSPCTSRGRRDQALPPLIAWRTPNETALESAENVGLTWMNPPSRGSIILPPSMGQSKQTKNGLESESRMAWSGFHMTHQQPLTSTATDQHPRSGDHLPGKQSSQPFRVR
jgi:hypothetical protein